MVCAALEVCFDDPWDEEVLVALDDPDFDPEPLVLEEPEVPEFEDVGVVLVESVCDVDCEDVSEPIATNEA